MSDYPPRVGKSENIYKLWESGEGDMGELAIGLYDLTAHYKALWDDYTQLEAENEKMKQLQDMEGIAKDYGLVGAPEVHRVWRSVMLEQERTVGPERMDWRHLPAQDKNLDEKIASAIVLDFLIWFFGHDMKEWGGLL